MATVEELQARLDALEKARDAGVLMVRHGDTSTQFRTLDEMNRIIADLKRQINKLNGVIRSRVNYVRQGTKGYGHHALSSERLKREFE